ncbi:amidohydrolase family protein [Flavobacteriaceae bacterium]|nr:amidohydrolase family protein [Flavobacteriaceae bacterium]
MLNTFKALLAVFVFVTPAVTAQSDNTFDLVIHAGRVIDPETQLDARRDIGIRGGRIVAVSETPLTGTQTIDASGQTVSPGFIDIHTHSPTLLGQHLSLHDGITSQLDLEMGAWPVSAYGDHFTGGAQINFGASVSHAAIRIKVIEGKDQPYAFAGRQIAMTMGSSAWNTPASNAQIEQMRTLLRQGLRNGGLGIGLLLDYMTSAISAEELAMVFDTAAEFQRPVAVHVRRGFPGDPMGIDEIIQQAKRSGAPVLISHITHSAMGSVGDWLDKIDAANQAGANITTETLSWPAGGTSISADVFRNRDWRKIFGIDYTDVQWITTGEWLTEETWHRYQQTMPYGMVNHHYVKEAWIERALQWPGMMVSTDALPALDLDIKTNPNIAGTFSRLLGHYVREQKVLTLSDAIKRITLLPAQWLEQASPVFKTKGRIQIGADADLVIFDPSVIATTARYGDPYQASVGINWVIVGGAVVIEKGQRLEGRYPGRRLIAPQID